MLSMNCPDAVSYTHLDVYKRQEPNEAVSGLQFDAANSLIRNDAEHLNERRQ